MNPIDESSGTVQPAMEISVSETAQLLERGEPCTLLDIREPLEVQVCQIKGSQHIPMGEIPSRWDALPRDQPILVYCHHGRRSLMVTQFLRQQGLQQAQSVAGGINAWSREIDPAIPRY